MITRRGAMALCAGPLLGQARGRVAITMDDVRWQAIPEDGRSEGEARLLDHLGKTRTFLFAIGECVGNAEGSGILKRWNAAGLTTLLERYQQQGYSRVMR